MYKRQELGFSDHTPWHYETSYHSTTVSYTHLNKHLISTFKWKCLEDSICQFPNHVEIGLVVMLDEKA